MSHDPPVERIGLDDGQWWEILTIVTRRMRKASRDAGLKAFLRGLHNGVQPDWMDTEGLQKMIEAHPEAWDLNAVDDAYLLYGTHAWSFQEPISLEAIDSKPAQIVDKVLMRMRELYAEPAEATVKK